MDIGAISKTLAQTATPSPAAGAAANAAQSVQGSRRREPDTSGTPVSERSDGAALAAVSTRDAGREQIEDAVASIQEFVQSVRRSINFSLEDGSGRVVVKVTDAESGNVIRQIPSEEALRLAENLSEVRSLLFEAEA